MDVKLLIDGVVRQTTVLIAQLSTSAGVRAPLAHVADQVFLELAAEIAAQGVSRKVAADMFGMALRSYQKKLRRLTESASVRNRTLWEAVMDFLSEQGSATRDRILSRFRFDEEREVAAVLNDLVGQGLIYATGRGNNTMYKLSSEDDRKQLAQKDTEESLLQMAWLALYRRALTRPELVAFLSADEAAVNAAVARLLADGHLTEDPDGKLKAETYLVPVGSERGWEAAVFDHFSAMAGAIASKLRRGTPRSQEEDVVGGATLTFELSQDHPSKDEVLGLLRRVRHDVNQLWQRVNAENTNYSEAQEGKFKVTFYFGQNVLDAEGEAS